MKNIALLEIGGNYFIGLAKKWMPPVIWNFLYRKLVVRNISDAQCYGMVFQPWLIPTRAHTYQLIQKKTLLRPEALYHLENSLRQALNFDGAVYELGVYKGGSARLIRDALQAAGRGRMFRLFDTFEGMKVANEELGDRHRAGDFSETSLKEVKAFVGEADWIDYRQGWVPETFVGLDDDKIAFAHIDLDLHTPIADAISFIYPRMVRGGMMVFDDYGFPSTPGARKAIDEFFLNRPEPLFVLQTGQAFVVKI